VEPSRPSDQHRQAGREPLLPQLPYLRSWTLAWIGVVVAAFINGVLHRGYEGALGELRAHQLSSGILLILIAPRVLHTERRHPLPSWPAAVRVGLLWAAATVAFEFSLATTSIRIVGRSCWTTMTCVRAGSGWSMSSLSPQHRR
jgi:hypothetical protein